MPLSQPFVTGSDKQRGDHMTGKLASAHPPAIPQITPSLLKPSHLVRFVAFMCYWIRLSFNYFMYLMLPETICTLLKIHTHDLYTSKVTACFSYWYFVSSETKRHCTIKCILIFLMVLWLGMNHIFQDSTVYCFFLNSGSRSSESLVKVWNRIYNHPLTCAFLSSDWIWKSLVLY